MARARRVKLEEIVAHLYFLHRKSIYSGGRLAPVADEAVSLFRQSPHICRNWRTGHGQLVNGEAKSASKAALQSLQQRLDEQARKRSEAGHRVYS